MLHLPALRRAAATALAASLAVLASACGGGGGGGGGTPSASFSGDLPSSVTLAGQCSLPDQKRWLRSYLDETYLWHDRVPAVSPDAYPSVDAYFDALLARTDGNGQALDRFSSTMASSVADAMQNAAAAAAGRAAAAGANPVPLVRTLATGSGRSVGYILFNEHTRGAQDALIAAFRQLQSAAVQDLVLDLRYNSGGFIYVAQAAASMVGGPAIDGQVFESVRYSAKRAHLNAANSFMFSTRAQSSDITSAAGDALPQLNLPRLYVLTSALTCSASESIINGLRGIGIQVVLVGDRTCGKPYGFHRKDNCGQAYFPIEFQVYNARGFGDYQAGFPVQCRVSENPTTALGSPAEPLLAAALTHIQTGSCPPGTATAFAASVLQQSAGAASTFDRAGAPAADSPMYQPGFNGRAMQP